VRDDIQRYIALTYPYSKKTQLALTNLARVNQSRLGSGALSDQKAALAASSLLGRALECLAYIYPPDGQNLALALLAETLNTEERSFAYIAYLNLLAGQMLGGSAPSEWRASCSGFDPDSFPN
jgi:hypothetical protein